MRGSANKLTLALVVFLFSFLVLSNSVLAQKAKLAAKGIDITECYNCHDTIKELHTMGKHVKVACTNCHGGLESISWTRVLQPAHRQTLPGKLAANAIRTSTTAP